MIGRFRAFSQGVFLIRAALAAFGLGALAWGVAVLPVVLRDGPIEAVAKRIALGDSFQMNVLAGQLPAAASAEGTAFCRPASVRSAAVIRLRLAELAAATGDSGLTESAVAAARRSIRAALSCSPSDPYLWLALHWTENGQSTDHPDFRYLRMSYRLGPHEGWIAVARNRIAFTLFDKLPSDLGDAALREFAGLLETGEYDATVQIFTGPAWPVHNLILPRLAAVSLQHRMAFAQAVYAAGYDVTVPGVAPHGPPAANRVFR
jgi:hypothetical protein